MTEEPKKFDPKTAPDDVALRIIAKAYGLTESGAREALAIMRGGEGDVREAVEAPSVRDGGCEAAPGA